jgi:hypothetical protein
MSTQLDKTRLLAALERANPSKKTGGSDDLLRRISLAAALPTLTGIDHEKEYRVCHAVATHLLERVPEPEEVERE